MDPFGPTPYAEQFCLYDRLWDLLAFGIVSGRLVDEEWDLIWDLLAVDQFDRLLRERRQAYEDGYYQGRVEGVHLGLAARRVA